MVDKKYSIIYADPPWDVKAGPRWSSSGKSGDLPYPTMKLDDIKNLNVKELAEKDAHLYLWTINKYLEQSYDVARKWGFKPVTLITWCKPQHGLGLGGSFVQTTEYLLLCKRGNLKTNKGVNTTWIAHKRLRHSEKPQIFRDLILQASGDFPRIELFARQKTEGWDVWGNEVQSDVELNFVRQKVDTPFK
jgi:N6-adenosine-specific RNA methylase IME4